MRVLIIIVVMVIIVISSLAFIFNAQTNYQNEFIPSRPMATITGNITYRHPYYSTDYGYASPNLWDFNYGYGNTNMTLYTNGSVYTIAKLYGRISIFAYPSVHFTLGMPMLLQSVYASNLASFVSFNIVTSKGAYEDVIYDLFLGQGGDLQYEMEIVLFLGHSKPEGLQKSLNFTSSMQVNGKNEDVTWYFLQGVSSAGSFPDYMFISSINTTNEMSYIVHFSPFLHFLQNNGYIPSTISIIRLGIGSEFGGGISPLTYSFWMYSYFMENGKKFQVIQPSGVITDE
ncbi:MAG: hypothetical protein QXV17_14660 [Candidatus Micrarchaeaceae archaeon]